VLVAIERAVLVDELAQHVELQDAVEMVGAGIEEEGEEG